MHYVQTRRAVNHLNEVVSASGRVFNAECIVEDDVHVITTHDVQVPDTLDVGSVAVRVVRA